jgi:hypothetical protein
MADEKDILIGCKAITKFLNEEILSEPVSESRVFHWLDSKIVTAGKFGASHTASKKKLRQQFAKVAGVE